jgi:hypothetical protein
MCCNFKTKWVYLTHLVLTSIVWCPGQNNIIYFLLYIHIIYFCPGHHTEPPGAAGCRWLRTHHSSRLPARYGWQGHLLSRRDSLTKNKPYGVVVSKTIKNMKCSFSLPYRIKLWFFTVNVKVKQSLMERNLKSTFKAGFLRMLWCSKFKFECSQNFFKDFLQGERAIAHHTGPVRIDGWMWWVDIEEKKTKSLSNAIFPG